MLVAWVLVQLLLLYPVVVPHHLTQVALETPDVLRSLSSLSKACLMSFLAFLRLVVPWSVSKVRVWLMSGPSCVCSGV